MVPRLPGGHVHVRARVPAGLNTRCALSSMVTDWMTWRFVRTEYLKLGHRTARQTSRQVWVWVLCVCVCARARERVRGMTGE